MDWFIFDQYIKNDRALFDQILDIVDHQPVTSPDFFPIISIFKHQWQDCRIDQILPMDACKAFGDDKPKPKILRGNGGMFAAWSLAIIMTGNNGMKLVFKCIGAPGGGVSRVDIVKR